MGIDLVTTEIAAFECLRSRIIDHSAIVGVIGLGYVGLPLAVAIARSAFATIGFDNDPAKPTLLNAGTSYIAATSNEDVKHLVAANRLRATSNFDELCHCDVIVICVPTPLTLNREPDLSYVESVTHAIAKHLRAGQLIVLESTTYPGTTREIVKPILESTGLTAGEEFFLGFSPEREDPGNKLFQTATIPKVVAGDGEPASSLVKLFYGAVVEKVIPVSSLEVAEAVKMTENIFRAVNIALVNELKIIYSAMGVDIWEVIEAAKTKPFGYMPFYPGPGLGGHCIPIDPFYLTWKAREHNLPTRFIELAGEINVSMPRYVIDVLASALDERLRVPISSARILIIGLAYKKNVPDIRESPALKLMEILEGRGATVQFHDPYVEQIPMTREYSSFHGRRSVMIDSEQLSGVDAVLIAADHDSVDYARIQKHAKLVVDTRNVMSRRGLHGDHIIKA